MTCATVRRPLCVFLLCLSVFLCGLTAPAPAQTQTGSISGTVTDATGSVLSGARVAIASKNLNTVTDQQGRFFLSGLLAGNYSLTITYIGFKTLPETVAVTADQNTDVKAQLEVATTSQSVLVTDDRISAEVEAVNIERSADNIVQVMPAEVMNSLPNTNLGEAIGRLPSVSLTRNEGEDQYVQVRGTEPRLTNTTIDGFNMPSQDPGVREIEFDVIPSGIVDSIEISKTLQANMDGDGIGGSVNIITKTATDKPTIEISGEAGYTPIQNGRPNTEEYGTYGRRFGAGKKFGFVIGGDYTWEGRGINDVEPTPDVAVLSNGQTKNWFDDQDIREYQFHRPRWGIDGSLDYRIHPGSTIFLRYLYSYYRDSGDKWVYSLHDNTPGITLLNPGNDGCQTDSNGTTVQPCTAAGGFYNQRENARIYSGSVQLSGMHVLANTWYSWNAAIGTGYFGDEPFDTAHFSNNLSTSSCQFNVGATTNNHLPQWSPQCFTEAYNPQNQILSDVQREPGHTEQINIGLAASGAFRYHIDSHISTFEYGAKFRSMHKYANTYNVTASPNGDIPLSTFPNRLKDPNYYNGGAYPTGYMANYDDVETYVNQNASLFTFSDDKGQDPADYGLVEHIPGFYVMNSTDFGRGIRLVAGLRAEITSDNVHNLAFGPSGPPVANLFSGSYYDVLPSASLRFNAGPNSFLRMIYARGVSRPEEQSLAQPLSWSSNGNGGNKYQVTFGNPNLKSETGDDIDVLYDHYFSTFGVLSAGYFYKRLGNPIITSQHQLLNYQPPGGPIGNYLATQPINAGSAWISGIELQYLQHYTNLPGFLSGLGMNANYSYIGSQTSGIPGRSDHPRLLDNAPNIFNISPTYDRGRLSMRLGINFNQSSIFAYQYATGLPGGINGPLSDVYFYDHTGVDAQGSVALRHGLKLVVYGLNLTNEVFGFYQGSQQFPIQREYYQPTFAGGIRWSPAR